MSYKSQLKVLTIGEVVTLLATLYFLGLRDNHIEFFKSFWKMWLFSFIILNIVRFIIVPNHRKFQFLGGIVLTLIGVLFAHLTFNLSTIIIVPAMYLIIKSHVRDNKREKMVDFKTLVD